MPHPCYGTSKCCIFFKNRQGAIMIAILGIVFGTLGFTYLLSRYDNIMSGIERNLKSVFVNLGNYEEVDNVPTFGMDVDVATSYVMYCIIAISILFTIKDFCLLFGLTNNSPIFLLIWLLVSGIGNLVSLAFYSQEYKLE